MKTVYLIRHGHPALIRDGAMGIGITDPPLSALGKAEAQALATHLPPVTAVFSSPLRRAVQTAHAFGMPVTVLDGLREINPHRPDGPDPDLIRFRAAMDEAAHRAAGDFLVVSHGGIIARFLQSLTGTFRKPDYAEVVTLGYDREEFFLIK